jgi:ATP-dependent exoDNAse (exonuclease V) beta subunit
VNVSNSLDAIRSIIDQAGGDSERFAETLRHQHIPHLSFSQISAVEFCHHRYYLQYVMVVDPVPLPDYFSKGKLLHQIIAASYQRMAGKKSVLTDENFTLIDGAYQGDHQRHLRNAFIVHMENLWQDCEIIAVEKPFAIQIESQLPPMVGVIDLILKQNGNYVLIDHKTGRDFYAQDELQMAIYRQFIQNQYGTSECFFYYDNYRWVNNLERIRKPAFQRVKVSLPPMYDGDAMQRIRKGHQIIQKIRSDEWGAKNGECFRCPYRKVCRDR